MNRDQATEYVSYVVDNALNGRRVNDDQHAVVRPDSVLVGWQCGFEPLFVSCHAYIPGCELGDEEAVELATHYLEEIGWFTDGRRDPDYVLLPQP